MHSVHHRECLNTCTPSYCAYPTLHKWYHTINEILPCVQTSIATRIFRHGVRCISASWRWTAVASDGSPNNGWKFPPLQQTRRQIQRSKCQTYELPQNSPSPMKIWWTGIMFLGEWYGRISRWFEVLNWHVLGSFTLHRINLPEDAPCGTVSFDQIVSRMNCPGTGSTLWMWDLCGWRTILQRFPMSTFTNEQFFPNTEFGQSFRMELLVYHGWF